MTARPIIMTGAGVRAILASRKSQIRRLIKPQPIGQPWFWTGDEVDPTPGWFDGYEQGRRSCGGAEREVNRPIKLPATGDQLWVREAWAYIPRSAYNLPKAVALHEPDMAAYYRADFDRSGKPGWRSPMFMPRWASRLTLTVTDVRVELLTDISEGDAKAEGLISQRSPITGKDIWNWDESATNDWEDWPRFAYLNLWESIHGPGSWAANPWICALTFTVARHNIDQEAA